MGDRFEVADRADPDNREIVLEICLCRVTAEALARVTVFAANFKTETADALASGIAWAICRDSTATGDSGGADKLSDLTGQDDP